MFHRRMHDVVTACGVAVALLAVPAHGKGCALLDGLCGGLCGRGALTTYRAPYVPSTYAPAYNPASSARAPQACRYVPQTCYRTVYRRVPVTSYRAVTGCDSRTGCPVTSYYPVTTWARQARLVPYTTYRMVYSPVRNPCLSSLPTACSPCGVAVSGCLPGACGMATSPATPYYGPSSPPAAATPNSSPPQPTFEEETNSSTETLKPIPSTELNSTPVPVLIDPYNRTTSRQGRGASYFHLIASPAKPAAVYPAPIDDGGWRASSD
jgi:hypothetical protein